MAVLADRQVENAKPQSMASGINIYYLLLISTIHIVDINNSIADISNVILISAITLVISTMHC